MSRSGTGFLWAVLIGLLAGMFLEPSIGRWAIVVGVALAMAVDWMIRRRAAGQREDDETPGR